MLDPPPVPTSPTPAPSPAADPVKPTVIRAAATGDVVDGASLTPPSVPTSPTEPDTSEEDDEVIDLRDAAPEATDSAGDEPGTRWTRPRR